MVPALAVADALRAEGAEVIFIGGERAERELVPAASFPLRTLRVQPLHRGRPLRAIRAALIDAAAVLRAWRLIKELNPGAVLGAGGYVAGPVGLAAVLHRLPLMLLEADSHLGLTNLLLAPFARRVFLGFPIAGREGARYLLTGRPVPAPAQDRAAARARFGIAPDETCVLVFGGSQGARSINWAAVEAFAGARFRVLHAAGERERSTLSPPGPHYDLRDYIPDFGEALLASDLVVSRAGGSVFEIAAHGRPAVLVPYPHATANHQAANASFMEEAGAAAVIPDRELTAARLAQEVGALLADRSRLQAMARAAAALARPEAARQIARELLAAAGAGELDAPPVSNPDWSSRRLHFVGIGGAGMSALALVAQALGAQVSGSDQAESSYTERLREHGIEPVIGHAAENVPLGAEVVYSTAVPADNPERQAAGGRELHRAELLEEVAELRQCLAVTGTHGKTTTAAMVVHALAHCGLDPSYVLGGELQSTASNAGWGSGEWIVVEADESDRSLLKVKPDIAVLTSVELDHHSTYTSRLELEETFKTFMTRAGERAVVWDRPELLALCPPGAVAYDAPEPELYAGGSRFEWRGIEVELTLPGAHNAINAAGALTAAALAGADPGGAAAALRDFGGARRRFERLGETAAGAALYDDYAHHPTEVAAAIAAARTLGPKRLVAVFQPHLYSRTQALWREFGSALAAADLVVVLSIYAARERAADFPGVDGRQVAAAAADAAPGRTIAWLPGFDEARVFLERTLRPGDVCLLMGAGDIDALGRSLLAAAAGPASTLTV